MNDDGRCKILRNDNANDNGSDYLISYFLYSDSEGTVGKREKNWQGAVKRKQANQLTLYKSKFKKNKPNLAKWIIWVAFLRLSGNFWEHVWFIQWKKVLKYYILRKNNDTVFKNDKSNINGKFYWHIYMVILCIPGLKYKLIYFIPGVEWTPRPPPFFRFTTGEKLQFAHWTPGVLNVNLRYICM